MSKQNLKELAKQHKISIGKINNNNVWKPKTKKELKDEILNVQGGSISSNYVKYLYGKDKFDIKKIKKPSMNLIKKFEVNNTETDETQQILNKFIDNIQKYNEMLNDIANELNKYKLNKYKNRYIQQQIIKKTMLYEHYLDELKLNVNKYNELAKIKFDDSNIKLIKINNI